jgi:polyisoprenoid-binding protein YceI
MSRRLLIVFISAGAAALLLAGVAAAYVLRTPAAPSGAITAIPVASTDTPQAALPTNTPAAGTQSGPITFELVQAESEARFSIDEVLNGSPKLVIGVTDQVAAQIVIDPANPAATQVGVIQINARTLSTDSSNRNRAIQNQILDTGEFEFVTFTPKSYANLPASVAVGDTFTFQMVGDLTIRHVTQEVTVDVTVTVESESRIRGLGTATINRSDFELTIPQVPQVASVDEDVLLELEFVAEAVN